MPIISIVSMVIGVILLFLIVHVVRSFQKGGTGEFNGTVALIMLLIFAETIILPIYAHFFM